MKIFEDTNPRELRELLEQINNREMALPDFQRDFVWDPGDTQDLIVSIARSFPAGSLLRIRNNRSLFAPREFAGAPSLNGHRPTYLVLDGQQRLTSLFQAFYGVGKYRYFVNVERLIADGDFEDAIFHFRANTRQARRLEQVEVQAGELVLPLSVLARGAANFFKWTEEIIKTGKATSAGEELRSSLQSVWDRWLAAVDDYKFPVVTLADHVNAEAVCTIFETLNRKGVKLSPFELLTARFWPQQINLRSLWASAADRYPLIDEFEIDPYYVLQVISLLSRKSPSCKRGEVLELDGASITTWWDKAVEGLALGLEYMRDDWGVLTPGWLPYDTLTVPLAAVLARKAPHKGPAQADVREKLGRWFWCSVFGQVYENAPNSRSAKDFAELLTWMDGGNPPETVATCTFDPKVLRTTTPSQRALYRGVICLVLRRAPRDFHSDAPLSRALIEANKVDDHHIFPKDYLGGSVSATVRDCVLNRTLIDRKTNQSIKARPPSEYMAEIRAGRRSTFDRLLKSHLLPTGESSPLLNDDFDAFLDWRQDAIWKEIRRVTGLNDAADEVVSEDAA